LPVHDNTLEQLVVSRLHVFIILIFFCFMIDRKLRVIKLMPTICILKERRIYWKLKEEALDRTLWRTRFGRRYGPVVRQTTE
jgi:hypothetical protein